MAARWCGRWSFLLAGLLVCVSVGLSVNQVHAQEIGYPNTEFAKLDVFEGNNLTKADKAFNAKQYRQALAEYDAFLLEFPNSTAVPYAVYRKGRSLQLDGKRFEAIKQYTQVLDFFPNDVAYASASLFQIGKSHWDNGDQDKASKFWSRLADDKQYARQPIAAAAINDLAGYLMQKNEQARAAAYFEQVAVDFRSANQQVARSAISSLIGYYVRTKPDEPKLRSIFQKTGGFDDKPVKVPPDLAADKSYWKRLTGYVKSNGQFTAAQAKEQEGYYRYWVSVLDGKWPDDDDYQIDLANFKLDYEKDPAKWVQRLDKQFADHQKPGDYSRVVKWVGLFAGDKKKSAEYLGKIQFDQMKPADILALYIIVADTGKDLDLSRTVFGKIPLGKFSDKEKTERILPEVAKRDQNLVVDLCASFENKELGQYRLFVYYQGIGANDKALPLADVLTKVPDYASDVFYRKGSILQRMKKYPEAIAAYRSADNPPSNLFRISECLSEQKKFDEAIAQLREVENFFKPQAASAALQIARLYNRAGQKEKYVSSLRGVLAKYPSSSESSQAHLELEAMGIKRLGGGQDAQ